MEDSIVSIVYQDVQDVYDCLSTALEYAREHKWINVEWWINAAEDHLEHLQRTQARLERKSE